jgi:hypothetical protein
MTDEERNQILKMIEGGKITAEEGLSLIHTLDEVPENEITTGSQDEKPMPSIEVINTPKVLSDQTVDKYKNFVNQFWRVVLGVGITFTVLSAVGVYWILQSQGLSAWLILVALPLIFGIVLIAFSAGGHQSHFIIVDVHQKKGEEPEHIFLGFPLPLKLFNWFIKTFKNVIPGLKNIDLEDFMTVLDNSVSKGEPMLINVEENSGEHVKVFMS